MSTMSTGLSDEERRAGARGKGRAFDQDTKPLTVTVETVCALTGLGLTKVWQLIRDGKLEVTRIGNRTLVRYASLERLLDDGARHPSRPGGVAAMSAAQRSERLTSPPPPKRPRPGATDRISTSNPAAWVQTHRPDPRGGARRPACRL
jgi:excisionase family DNA binding protein